MKNIILEVPAPHSPEMADFQKVTDCLAEEMNAYIAKIQKELHVSDETAGNICYLRGRSHWTQATEDRIIQADHAGIVVNVLSGDHEEELSAAGF